MAHGEADTNSHTHAGHHHLAPEEYTRAFGIGIALNTAFVIIEGVFGFLSGSLALIADAGHNLSDVLGLLLAWGAERLGRRAPTERRTYGWGKSSVLAALTNAVILLIAVGAIGLEAIRRLIDPPQVAGITVIVVAAIGLAINTFTALLFVRGRHQDLNIRGAFLHMAADAGVSAGVVVAGLFIYFTGALWLDPIVSLIVAGAILASTWQLLRDSFNLALDAVPAGYEPTAIRQYLESLEGVTAVHDLHIWGLSTTETALTAHLVKPDPARDDAILAEASQGLHDRFGIEHVTLQYERTPAREECPTESGHD
jgi:cobalt-zinc-cadmium efflux system protein